MAEHIIARITDAGILANDLAENLSAKHQIALVGHDTDKGGESTATLDGYSMFPSNTQGLCCIHVSTDNVVLARETFNFSVAAAPAAFDTWLSSRTTGVICMVSYGSNTSTTVVDNKFKSIGCENWQYYWKTSDGSDKSSFVGIYDCPLKKLMTYQLIGPGTTFDSARLQVQYDTFDDIGVTGYGDAIIWDETEYIHAGDGTYGFKTYLDTQLSAVGLTSGETIETYCELWQDNVTVNDGSRCALLIQFKNNGIWTSSFNVALEPTEVNEWFGKRLTVKIPDNVTEIQIGAYRNPQVNTSKGKVGIRDVVLKTRKPVVSKTRAGSAGQWGFITESAREVSRLPTIASSQNKKLDAYRFGTIGNETFGRMSGTGYFQLPDWLTLSSKYTVEVSMIWDYDATVETMLSGQDSADGRLMVGIRTDNNSSASDLEGHLFYIENQVLRVPEKIVYGRTYTYTIAVDNLSYECFVNKQSYGTGSIQTCPRKFMKFLIGAVGTDTTPKNFCLGAATGCNLIDVNYPSNSKFYNLVLDGIPASNTVRGRSAFSGMPYTVEGNPVTAMSALYCGPNSVTEYGMQTGDECWVTVLDWGGNAPVNTSWEINKRYKCYVGDGLASGYTATNKFKIYNPDGGVDWINSGNMQTTIFRVEYTAHPECDATAVNIIWLPYKKAFIDFNGSVYYDIPPIAAQEDFIVKIQRDVLTQNGYILEGRLGTQTQECSMYIQPDGKLKQAGTLKIDRVNGVDYVDGTTVIEVGTPYVITGSLTHLGRVGARYDGGMAFKGFIGDLTIEDGSDTMNRHYSGYLTTPFVSRSTSVIDSNQKGILCYSEVDVHDSVYNTNVAIQGRQKFNVPVALSGVGTGVAFTAAELGLLEGDRFRVEYDITSTSAIELKCGSTIDALNPTMKSIPAGRNSGYISYKHDATSDYDIGLYIRIPPPVAAGAYVVINKLNVFRDTDDGICSNNSAGYVYKAFDGPNIRTPTKRKWCPNFGTGWVNIPKWTPDPKNWRIRATVIIPAATENDYQTIMSGIEQTKSIMTLDIRGSAKNINFHTYNSAGVTGGSLVAPHGLNVGDIADIYVECVNGVCSMKLNGKVLRTGTIIMDGTESITNIGYRSSSSPNWKYTSDILRIELTDTTNLLFNSRVYDLTKSTNIRPTDLLIQPDESYLKFLKIGQGTGYVGWDTAVYPAIGYFKDSHIVNGYKMLYVKNDSTYSMRMKLDKSETPFGYFIVDFYESINEKPIKVASGNAVVVNGEYCIQKTTSIDTWFNSVNATKRIIFRPRGAGSNLVLTNFTTAWREVSALGAKIGAK